MNGTPADSSRIEYETSLDSMSIECQGWIEFVGYAHGIVDAIIEHAE